MLEARFVPRKRWPGKPTAQRRDAVFRASWPSTLDLLEEELRRLGAQNITVEVDLEFSEIRNDGWPRSTASPRSPAVIVAFESKKGPMCFPCDRFRDWKDNIRAIALSLQALRAVDRYGVTQSAEQYRGWQQLPPPSQATSFADPWASLARFAGLSEIDARRDPQSAYRAASMRTHPDRGGRTEDFQELQRVWSMLKG